MNDLSDSNFNENPQSPFLASSVNSSALAGSGSNAPANSAAAVSASQVADVSAFISYMKQFVPVLLDANLATIADFEKCMNEKTSSETIKKFLGETQVRTLIIQKFIIKGKSFFNI
jgi:hypothetical protein